MLSFKGYATQNVKDAAKMYKQKTGFEPTILLIKDDFIVDGDHPALMRSKHGAHGLILASHLLSADEIEEMSGHRETGETIQPTAEGMQQADLSSKSTEVKLPTAGRPKHGGGICPHCQQKINNFDTLGYWYGWNLGIEPPYWEELRLYVFQRDGFYCTKCNHMFSMSGLECHHIEPKETGGSDSARNLTTLCKNCHLDSKPIMPE